MLACVAHDSFAQRDPTDYEELWKRGAYREALDALNAKIEPRMPNVPSFWIEERGELKFMVGDVDGAIEDYTLLTEATGDAAWTLRLAEFYRYRGRTTEYEEALANTARRLEVSWDYYDAEKAMLTAGRIAELQGDDPKRILSTVYKIAMENAREHAPIFVAAGKLALGKASYAAATGYFTQALEADAENPQALAGLAACYWEARDERLEETLAKLEAINPHFPDGVAVRVEMLLDAGKFEEALPRIDAVLAVNPNERRFRALKAAALFLAYDDPGMAQVQQDALAFNPLASEVYREPGRVASRHYRFKEAEAFQRKALEVDPKDHVARAELGLNLLRLGRDADGRAELDAAFKADAYNVHVFNSLKVLDTIATFETVTRGDFELTLPKDEAPILAHDALALLDEASALLQQKYAITIETPVRVQIFNNHDDFMVRSLGLPGNAGHMGICFGQLITMDSPSARPKGSMDWHSVLWHEFAHVITLQKTKNRMPRWLSEGISVYEETQRNPGWGMRPEPSHAELIDRAVLPGASDLELLFTQPKTPAHLMLGYFLAGEFVAQYVATHGESALVDALERMGRAEPAMDALAAGAETTLESLDQEFKTYLAKRYAVLDAVPQFVESMRRGEEAFAAKDWAVAEIAFTEARGLMPEYGGLDGPLMRLSEIYDATDRPEALKGTLETILGLDSGVLPAWKKLAALSEESADWDGVLKAAAGAAAIDPFDVEMARTLLRAQEARGEHEAALGTIERLKQIDAPRASEYQLSEVDVLMRLTRWDEAKRRVVMLLEEQPHYLEAQEKLLALVERNANP